MVNMSENNEVIIPRYEFRAFAQSFGKVIDEIRRRARPELIRESSDTYLVTRENNTHNVKLRYDQLDVKELINVQDGLEQWYPTLKVNFPVEPAHIRDDIFSSLKVQAPALERNVYSEERFLKEVIWPHDTVQQAQVFKQRFHFMIEGCMVEINELLVNGAAIKSVAVEAEGVELVLKVRDMIGLGAYENVNYLKMIKRILGLTPLPPDSWFT
jgi:exopolyphosphatase/guanosine-5'-triphosphate,3'-diphosphate pyrophosphatase